RQRNVAIDLIHLCPEQPAAVRRNGQAGNSRWERVLKCGGYGHPAGAETVKLNQRAFRRLRRDQPESPGGDCPFAAPSCLKMIAHVRLGAASNRDAPDARLAASFGVVEILAVRRFHVVESALLRNLHSLSAPGWLFRRHLPDLLAAATIRAKVDPLPVARPTRHYVFGGFGRQPARFAAFDVDDVNVGAIFRARIEDDLSPVRRPAWRPRNQMIE